MHFQGLVIWNQHLMEVAAGTPKNSKETLYCANQNGNTGSLTSYNLFKVTMEPPEMDPPPPHTQTHEPE